MRDSSISLSEEAIAICQVLLDHQHALLSSPKQPPFQQCLLTYGDICEAARLPLLTQSVNRCLWEIAEFCADNEWPPLNALVVNARTREPDKSYAKAPGCSLRNWLDEAQRVINYPHYPDLLQA